MTKTEYEQQDSSLKTLGFWLVLSGSLILFAKWIEKN